jgi:hypothetical protein
MPFFYTYILQSELETKHFYIGRTEGLHARLKNTMPVKFLTQSNFDRGKSKLQLPSQTKSEPLNLNAISKPLQDALLPKSVFEFQNATAPLGGIRFFTRPALSGVVAVVIGCRCVLIVEFLFDKLSNRFKLEARMTEEHMIRLNKFIKP